MQPSKRGSDRQIQEEREADTNCDEDGRSKRIVGTFQLLSEPFTVICPPIQFDDFVTCSQNALEVCRTEA